jgi:leucyl aminopeptidase (aminopeptidase T)
MGNLHDVLSTCLGIKQDETVLIVTDDRKQEVARKIEDAVKALSGEVMVMRMVPRSHHTEEPPKAVYQAMKVADVVIMPTTMSLTHTDARKKACESGARVASMPGITLGMLTRGGMTADYEEVREVSNTLAERLSRGRKLEIKTGTGTDFFAGIADRKALSDSGIFTEKGQFGNLPAGEVFIAPVEGLSHGTLVIDGSMGGMGRLKEPIKVSVEAGKVIAVEGEDGRLMELLEKYENAKNVAEVGIGTNPKAKIIGNVLEDEKVLGTVHVAFGDNHTFGGDTRAEIHLDGIIKRPDIWLDGDMVMEDGKLLLEV